MKIPISCSPTVNERLHDLSTAIRLKGHKLAHEDLSVKTQNKLATIANKQYGYGIGTAFTRSLQDAPVLKSDACQAKLESLRSTLIVERDMFLKGSNVGKYLDQVIARVSQALPLAGPSNPPQPGPKRFQFSPDTKMWDGGREAQLLDKGKGKKNEVEDTYPTAEQVLSCFVREDRKCRGDMVEARMAGQKYAPPSFSTTDMRQFWTAALHIGAIVDTLEATSTGRALGTRVVAALKYQTLSTAEQKIHAAPQPRIPGPRVLLDLIRESDWRPSR